VFKNLIGKIRNETDAPSFLTTALAFAAVVWGLQTLNEAVLERSIRLDDLDKQIQGRQIRLRELDALHAARLDDIAAQVGVVSAEVIEPEPAEAGS
jgi:hypothetical protein